MRMELQAAALMITGADAFSLSLTNKPRSSQLTTETVHPVTSQSEVQILVYTFSNHHERKAVHNDVHWHGTRSGTEDRKLHLTQL